MRYIDTAPYYGFGRAERCVRRRAGNRHWANEREVLLEAMEWGSWDVFLLAGRYTLLEQAPLDDLLPKCQKAGTSIVVGGPLSSGILAGRDTRNYQTAPPEVVTRGQWHQGGLRQSSGASCGSGIAVPARASGGGGGDSRPAQCRGVSCQSGVTTEPDPGPAVGRPSRCRLASPRGADASLTAMLRGGLEGFCVWAGAIFCRFR